MTKQLVVQPPGEHPGDSGTPFYKAFISDEKGVVVLHSASGESAVNDSALGAVRSLALLLSDMIDARDVRLAHDADLEKAVASAVSAQKPTP
jgi:hypothetical protein